MSKKKAIVKKSNQLVTARVDFSVSEIRLFNLMVSQISNDDEDFQVYQIPAQGFIKTFNIKNKNIYKELNSITDSLLTKIIKIPIEEWGDEKLLKVGLVSSFKYNVDGKGMIEASFHPDLKPYLLQLKNRFLMYDMKHVLNISSSNSIRMYELLKAFEGIGKRTFDLDELKEILGVEEKYNKRYYNFKKRIILQAQKDLEKHTDICFSFKETKFPWTKKVEKITFFISNNAQNKLKKESQQSVQKPLFDNANRPLKGGLKRLNKYKFSPEIIEKEILWKYEMDYIEKTLNHCENYFKQANIPNKEGFILTALSKRYYANEIAKEKEKLEERSKQKELFEQQNNIEKQFQSYLAEQLELAKNSLSEAESNEFKNAFLSKMEGNSFFKTILMTHGFEHKIIQGQFDIFLRDALLTEKQRSFDHFVKSL